MLPSGVLSSFSQWATVWKGIDTWAITIFIAWQCNGSSAGWGREGQREVSSSHWNKGANGVVTRSTWGIKNLPIISTLGGGGRDGEHCRWSFFFLCIQLAKMGAFIYLSSPVSTWLQERWEVLHGITRHTRLSDFSRK